jgi:hypothetical protein
MGGSLRTRLVGVAVGVLIGSLGVAVGLAAAAAPGLYTGGGGHRGSAQSRWMTIAIQVLPHGRPANWDVGVFGPCSNPTYGNGTDIGTDAGDIPPDPPLRIRHGRFALRRHGVSPTLVHWSWALTGHTTRHGFAGTFHYRDWWTQSGTKITCDSLLMHWRALPGKGPFP